MCVARHDCARMGARMCRVCLRVVAMLHGIAPHAISTILRRPQWWRREKQC